MRRSWQTLGPAVAGLLFAAACTEPTDCKREPERCLLPAAQPEAVGAAANAPGKPAVGPQFRPVAGAVPQLPDAALSPRVRAAVAKAQLQAHAECPPLGLGQAGLAPAAVNPGLVAGESPDALLARGVLAGLRGPAASHELPKLAPVITKRLLADMGPKMEQYGPRFWRHVDKYIKAADDGILKITAEPGDSADRKNISISLTGGEELRPILQREDGAWKIDRF